MLFGSQLPWLSTNSSIWDFLRRIAGDCEVKTFRMLVPVVVLCLGLAGLSAIAVHRVGDIKRDCNALSVIAATLSDYAREHGGAWPTGWEDLSSSFSRVNRAMGCAWTMSELQKRIWLDFRSENKDGSNNAFGLKSGRRVRWEGKSPWAIVDDAFQRAATQ